jgi:hypothetical protein
MLNRRVALALETPGHRMQHSPQGAILGLGAMSENLPTPLMLDDFAGLIADLARIAEGLRGLRVEVTSARDDVAALTTILRRVESNQARTLDELRANRIAETATKP